MPTNVYVVYQTNTYTLVVNGTDVSLPLVGDHLQVPVNGVITRTTVTERNFMYGISANAPVLEVTLVAI